VSRQERKLPTSDQEIVVLWDLLGRNYSAVAREYNCNEASVRKRIQRHFGAGAPLTDYRMLPIPVEQLYREWLQLGAKYGAGVKLAQRYGVRPDTVRRAIRRYRERNSRNG
jgi:transposase-like protein